MNLDINELVYILLIWLSLSIPASLSLYFYYKRRSESVPVNSPISAATYATMEQTIRDMSIRMAELEEAQRSSNLLIVEIEHELALWRAYARLTYKRLRELGDTEHPAPPDVQRSTVPINRQNIQKEIAARFSMDEINDLAFQLGLQDDVTGETVSSRAKSLVLAAGRRDILPKLVEIAKRDRPSGTWQ